MVQYEGTLNPNHKGAQSDFHSCASKHCMRVSPHYSPGINWSLYKVRIPALIPLVVKEQRLKQVAASFQRSTKEGKEFKPMRRPTGHVL